MNNRLILVEGIPGVGKIITASNIKKYLDDKDIQSKLYLEGHLEHPADYEGVAYLKIGKYRQLISKCKINEEVIKEYINLKDKECFINYGMIGNDKTFKDSNEFNEELMNI